MRIRSVASLSAAAFLAVAGCGDSSDHSAPPPLPPDPVAQQTAEWRAATARAEAVAADMTRAEMLALIRGQSKPAGDVHFSAGYVPSVTVSKTGFVIPAQYLCDGPSGAGNGNKSVTQFPTTISLAASFDVELARRFGEALGNEWFEKGCTYGLGPGINIIRLPQAGRSAEYYAEDPYLASRIAVSEVGGIQSQHVVATLKHYAANNQETERSGGNSALSERTLREVYLPAFEWGVKEAGAGALMCSYNRLNGTYACGNAHLQNEIAREGWGFAGMIMSDWGANHGNTPVLAPEYALAGLDMDMPGTGAGNFNEANMAAVSDEHLRTMCTRILAPMFKVGIFQEDGTVLSADVSDANKNVSTDAHKQLAQDIAAAGTVLLKNVGGVLPLDRNDPSLKIVVIGEAAKDKPQTSLGGSGNILSSETPESPYDAMVALQPQAQLTYSWGAPAGAGTLGDLATQVHSVSGAATNDGFLPSYTLADGVTRLYVDAAMGAFPAATRISVPRTVYRADGTAVALNNGSANFLASFTGYLTAPADGLYQFSLAGKSRVGLRVDGVERISVSTPLLVETTSTQLALAAGEHKVEITIDTTAGYAWFSTPSASAQCDGGANFLDQAVAAAAAADVAVVVVSDTETEGSDHSAYLPSVENLLVERVAAVARKTVVVLNSGSGLVLPWADKVDAIVQEWYGGQRLGYATAAILFGDVNPSGRSVVTFPVSMAQWYAQEPSQFPGVRLNPTDAYRTVSYDEGLLVGYRWFDQHDLTPLFPFGHGLSYTTFAYSGLSLSSRSGKGTVTASVKITNTGARDGAEVAQLYVRFPEWAGEPPRQLKGFQKVFLAAGESSTVTFPLEPRTFQYWDDARGAWVMPAGEFQLYVGASSRDIRAVGSYTVTP